MEILTRKSCKSRQTEKSRLKYISNVWGWLSPAFPPPNYYRRSTIREKKEANKGWQVRTLPTSRIPACLDLFPLMKGSLRELGRAFKMVKSKQDIGTGQLLLAGWHWVQVTTTRAHSHIKWPQQMALIRVISELCQQSETQWNIVANSLLWLDLFLKSKARGDLHHGRGSTPLFGKWGKN